MKQGDSASIFLKGNWWFLPGELEREVGLGHH